VKITNSTGSLVILNWEDLAFSASVQMLWNKDKWVSPALQAFLEIAREVWKTGVSSNRLEEQFAVPQP
jgi:hypothetical protein